MTTAFQAAPTKTDRCVSPLTGQMETIQYTSDPPSDLLCAACLRPPLWPRFCSTCWRLTCRDCPNDTCCADQPCGEVDGRGPLGQRLGALPCQCPIESCRWTGCRRDYLSHYTVCSASRRSCPFSCGEQVHLIHDRWHWPTCPGYRAYLTDWLDTDPLRTALAIKIEHSLRQPLVLEDGEEVQLPEAGIRWRVFGYQWVSCQSLQYGLTRHEGVYHSSSAGGPAVPFYETPQSAFYWVTGTSRHNLTLRARGGQVTLWYDGLVE